MKSLKEFHEGTHKDSHSKMYHAKKLMSFTSSDDSSWSSVPPFDKSETESHDMLIFSGNDDPVEEGEEPFQVGLPAVND